MKRFAIKEKLAVLDLEIYPNYSLFAFKSYATKKLVTFELRGDDAVLSDEQKRRMRAILKTCTTFGFNSLNFDMPLIMAALNGYCAYDLFEMCEEIINENAKHWQTYRRHSLSDPAIMGYDHFDLIEPAPAVGASLKLYMARLHCPKLQDLPIKAGTTLSYKQMEETLAYCENDLDGTIALYEKIATPIHLRCAMSNEYGIDLRSKSDAQIAEAVMKSEVEKITGRKLEKQKVHPKSVRYDAPTNIRFKTPILQNLFEIIKNHEFDLDGKGSIVLPEEISKYELTIGETKYQVGVGGLHSKDSGLVVEPKDDEILCDRDVASYYPNIILNLKLFPKHVGKVFLDVYDRIVNRRLAAKAAKNKSTAETLKIVINGLFGKLGSMYSLFYSPDLMAKVTLSGQLYLLMLIEKLELHGIKVVSANTDGIVSKMSKGLYATYDKICKQWEAHTGFILEETMYKGLFSRDVNNYFALTLDGEVKGKGVFAEESLKKSPTARVVSDAVIAAVQNGTDFEEYLRSENDFTKFLHARTVNGGAEVNGDYLGRVVRWAYTTEGTVIKYAKNGNKVAKSDGGQPFQILPSEFPKNLEYARYVNECEELYKSIFGAVNVRKGTRKEVCESC